MTTDRLAPPPTLRQFLIKAISDALPDEERANPSARSRQAKNLGSLDRLNPWAERVADELIAAAVASGLPLAQTQILGQSLSGGNTADTGYPTYSTGAHLCVQTQVAYRTAFPMGTDACR